MPSKIQLDENLWFLYTCIQNSDLKTIDFTAVGLTCSIKAPAARMRYTRLRRQIESGALIGKHGMPFPPASRCVSAGVSVKEDSEKKFNKRKCTQSETKSLTPAASKSSAPQQGKKGGNSSETPKKIKVKEEYYHDSSLLSLSSLYAKNGESEDELPLAKLRKFNTSTGTARSNKIRERFRASSISSSISPSTPALHPAIITRPPRSASREWVKIGTHFPASPTLPSSRDLSTNGPDSSTTSASTICTSTTNSTVGPKRDVPNLVLANIATVQRRPYISPYACMTGPVPKDETFAPVIWHSRVSSRNLGGSSGGSSGIGDGVGMKKEFGKPYAPGAWGVLVRDRDI